MHDFMGFRVGGLIGLSLVISAALSHGQELADVTIQAEKVVDGIYMLTGRGGNIGLSVGSDGAFVIDDQFAPLTEKIKQAIADVTPRPVRFVLNTHWHGDHVGGNENFRGLGAIIVAHRNVRQRMSTEQFNKAFNRTTPPSPDAALPVITFEKTMSFHWNGDEIHIFHMPSAHTDGDAIVHFKNANVFHTGDTYFNGMYPFIDSSSGGGIDGMIRAASTVLELANESTRIIPGHGPLSNAAELKAYRDMLVDVRERIAKLIEEGKGLEEIVSLRPTRAHDPTWGSGFLNADRWVRIVAGGMLESRQKP